MEQFCTAKKETKILETLMIANSAEEIDKLEQTIIPPKIKLKKE
jgi:hypothetical protein